LGPQGVTGLHTTSSYATTPTNNDGGTPPIFDQTNSMTVNASFAYGAYSFSWSKVSGNGAIDSTSPAGVNPATATVFLQGHAGVFSGTNIVVQCVVTDTTSGKTMTQTQTIPWG
jgi:hypothetical protein